MTPMSGESPTPLESKNPSTSPVAPLPSYRSAFVPIGIGITFVILAVMLAGALVAWWYTERTLRRQARGAFEDVVNQATATIHRRADRYLDVLRGFKGLYAASKSVERDEFAAYYYGLKLPEHFSGMLAIDFVEWVKQEAVEAFLQRVRADTSLTPEGYPSFHIYPEEKHSEYFVVTFTEPHDKYEQILGYDLGSELIRREALERARDTGELSVTEWIHLIIDADKSEPAFLVFAPIYRNREPVNTLEERRNALSGFVSGVFRSQEFFQDLLNPRELPSDIHFEVFDGELLSADKRLYQSSTRAEDKQQSKGVFTRIETLPLGGRIWVFRFQGPSDFRMQRFDRLLPLAVLWGGITVSLLVFAVLYGMATSRSRALALAEQITGDLKRRETHFRSLIEHGQDLIIIMEPLGLIRYVSPSVEKITGYKPEELQGQSAFTFMHPEDVSRVTGVLAETIKTPGAVRSVTFRSRHKQGPWVTLEAICTNLITNPVVQGIVVNARDVSERSEAQRQLHESSERFRTLVSNLPGVVYRCACDSNWTMAFISDAVEVLSGYPSSDFIGNNVRSYASIIHPEDRLMVERVVLDSVVRKEPYVAEYRIQHTDGSLRWAYEKGRGVFTEDGNLLYLDGAIFDVTERKKAEESLKATYQRLQQTQDQLLQSEKLASIGQLAAGVAHEVKNPLAVVIQGVNFLEAGPLAKQEQEQEILEMMKKAVLRADHIIKSLLEFARPSSMQLKRANIQEIIQSSIDLAKTQLSSRQIPIAYTADPNTPEVLIDGNQMRQVFVNLVVNAFQAMPNGGDVIIRSFGKPVTSLELDHCRKVPASWQAGQMGVFCEVEDSGMGISESALKKVGDPFFTTKPTGQGTGLGLSVTQTILDSHHGLLIIDSREGKGTKMTVILPTADERSHG